MIARLQRLLVLAVLGASLSCLAGLWSTSSLAAVAGVAAILGLHAVVLAVEFVTGWQVSAHDVVARARIGRQLRAWAGESLIAPYVFCWLQPFRSAALADHLPTRRRRGAVLVHGFLCNRGFWNPWLRRLRADDRAFVAVDLEPVCGPIDAYVQTIEEAVQRVAAATGLAPLLVCHSMGGLAARAWLRNADCTRISRIVTIGTPHAGTWLARFGRTRNSVQMRIGSDWLRELQDALADASKGPFTCWHSNCDNVVFPPSNATLPAADNRLIEGKGHVQMAFDSALLRQTLALLEES